MATWNSRGLRGSTFEDLINRSNEQYRERGLGLIQKIPTPITPVRLDKGQGVITLAYFEKQSTVDYIGAVQNVPVCFDAKECAYERFALANVHEHQLQFMRDYEKQGGIAFLLVFYSKLDLIYYVPLRLFEVFWKRMEEGGRKSFLREEIPEKWILHKKSGVFVPYLDGIALDLQERDD